MRRGPCPDCGGGYRQTA